MVFLCSREKSRSCLAVRFLLLSVTQLVSDNLVKRLPLSKPQCVPFLNLVFRSDLYSSSLDRGPSSSFAVWISRMFFLSGVESIERYRCRRCLFGRLHREGHFRPCSRMFQSHHRRHRERNTLWPSSVGWKGVVLSSYEQCVFLEFRKQTEWRRCAFVIMCLSLNSLNC